MWGARGQGTNVGGNDKADYADGGTFSTTLGGDPGNLDPLLTSDQVSNELLAYTYDTLINIDEKGNPVRQLATKWQVTPSSVTFTLDKNVTCADGSKLTARQVAATFEFIKNPANQSTMIGSSLPNTDFIVRADDTAGTVTISLAKPYGFLLTGAVLVRIVCAKGTANRKLLARGTDGTGPFTLAESVSSDHYTFVARKDFRWGPGGAGTDAPGFPNKVVFKVVQSETTANNLFLNGQLNQVSVVGVERKRLEGRGFYAVTQPGSMIELFFNQRPGHPGADQARTEGNAYMKWKNLGEHTVYENQWLCVNLADVELPDGRHLEHFLLRQRPVALTVALNERDEALLLWRHRFITDTWGWELPAGVVDDGETIEEAAARETLEETGWRPGPLHHLITLEPSNGLSDARHHVFWAEGAEHVGEPIDDFESDRRDWVPLSSVPDLIVKGEIPSSNAVAALLMLRHMRRRQLPSS